MTRPDLNATLIQLIPKEVIMDKKHIELMLQLAEDKKRELEVVITDLKEQLRSSTTGRKRGRPTGTARQPGESVQMIRQVLAGTNRLMSPAEIYQQLLAMGAKIKSAQVRNLLTRYRGEFFESPEHGQWKEKDRNFEIRRVMVRSTKDDDLPF